MENQPDPFNSRLQKAFDFCAETSKQLINIAVGIIAFTITFSKDFIGEVDNFAKWVAAFAWFLFFFSVLLGILTLSALTAQLEPGGEEQEKPSTWSASVTNLVKGQWVSFMAGLFLTFIFGCLALCNQKDEGSSNKVELSLPNSVVTVTFQDTSQKKAITNLINVSPPVSTTESKVKKNK